MKNAKLLYFTDITIALLIAVSIYCYLMKHQAKQKHLSRFHYTNNETREVYINKYVIKMYNKVKVIDIKNRTY